MDNKDTWGCQFLVPWRSREIAWLYPPWYQHAWDLVDTQLDATKIVVRDCLQDVKERVDVSLLIFQRVGRLPKKRGNENGLSSWMRSRERMSSDSLKKILNMQEKQYEVEGRAIGAKHKD